MTQRKSGRQSISGRTPKINTWVWTFTNFCWELQITWIKTPLLKILLETLGLSSSQRIPTDEETSWSWNYLGYNLLDECIIIWGFKLLFISNNLSWTVSLYYANVQFTPWRVINGKQYSMQNLGSNVCTINIH